MTPALVLRLTHTNTGRPSHTPHTSATWNCQTSGILLFPWMWSAISINAELTITYEWTSIDIYLWLWLPLWWTACLWAWPIFPLGCLSSYWFIGVLYVFCILIHYLLYVVKVFWQEIIYLLTMFMAFFQRKVLYADISKSITPLCLHFCFILEIVLYCEVIKYIPILYFFKFCL